MRLNHYANESLQTGMNTSFNNNWRNRNLMKQQIRLLVLSFIFITCLLLSQPGKAYAQNSSWEVDSIDNGDIKRADDIGSEVGRRGS